MIYLGVDWAGKGWLSVRLSPREERVEYYPSFHALLVNNRRAERILVDIPIGLHEREQRTCDRRAREVLPSPLKSSIFNVPVRPAVYARNLLEARRIHRTIGVGFGISNQAWSIVPRIREVDLCLRTMPNARETVRETHPELGFQQLGENAAPTRRKRTEEGRRQREHVLKQHLERGRFEALNRSFQQLTRPDYAPLLSSRACFDDFLDAIVATICAREPPGQRRTLPEDVPTDAEGLPMAIHC